MKVVLGCLVEILTGREQWRRVRMVCGDLYVTINGILKMLLWYVDNWGTLLMVSEINVTVNNSLTHKCLYSQFISNQ